MSACFGGLREGGENFSRAPIGLVRSALREARVDLAGSFTTLDHVRWIDEQRAEAVLAIAESLAQSLPASP